MKVIHLNINEMSGGAARAAHRLHSGLLSVGVDSHMGVLRRTSPDPRVRVITMNRVQRMVRRAMIRQERPSQRHYPHYQGTPWSTGRLSMPVMQHIKQHHAHHPTDIVHLHWIGDGFVSIKTLAEIKTPLVWTLHDMWAMTGGCHYAGDCIKYQQQCGACPQLGSDDENDLSRRIWREKHQHWHNLNPDLNLTIVAPSQWMARCASSSSLLKDFRIEVIPNGIDLQTYRPFDQGFAREVLNLPADKKLLLFGAYQVDDGRKGFPYLINALRMLDKDEVELVIFGGGEAPPDVDHVVHHAGSLHDDRLLALLYSAVDVFVAPSVQDNLPNTVMEAIACGTPTAAFNIGGMSDMIDHQQNGYLARPLDAADLAQGIRWMIEDPDRWWRLSEQARNSAGRFELVEIARRYRALYEALILTP